MKKVKYRHNKDGTDLEQINLALVIFEESLFPEI
jgi:transposase